MKEEEEEEEKENVGTLQVIASCEVHTSGELHVGAAAGGLEEAMRRRKDRWTD